MNNCNNFKKHFNLHKILKHKLFVSESYLSFFAACRNMTICDGMEKILQDIADNKNKK